MPNEVPPDHTNQALRAAYNAPRQYHDATDYDAIFGDNLAACQTILEVGAGGGDFVNAKAAAGKQVTLADVHYGRQAPDYGQKNAVAALGQALPFAEESFDACVSAFTIQHVDPADQDAFVREMVRVTRPAEDTSDASRGIIIVHPVFRAEALRQRLASNSGLAKCAAVGSANPSDTNLSIKGRRRLSDSFLLIHKNPELTEERLTQLVTTLSETRSLIPRVRTIGERAVRLTQWLQERRSRAA